jgi:DNA-binding NarL/FixJ family response regulator
MDVGMKDVNGIDLTRQLLAERRAAGARAQHVRQPRVREPRDAGRRARLRAEGRPRTTSSTRSPPSPGGTFLSPAMSGRLFRSQTPRPVMSLRESEILACLAKGRSSKQIAQELT